MFLVYIFIFLAACFLMFWVGKWIIDAINRLARFLGWREFVVAFFIMAFATSFPNLFVGISAARHNIPQLSFGDVMGANVIDLTLALALSALIAKGLPAQSRLIQNTAIFT